MRKHLSSEISSYEEIQYDCVNEYENEREEDKEEDHTFYNELDY